MEKEGVDDSTLFAELGAAWKRDHHFCDGKVLSPMMTTPLPAAIKAYEMFIESNLGNPGLYPGTKELENKVINWLGELLHAPPTMVGQITSGGTDSNITALWMAKKRTGKKRVLFSANAHFSMPKACDILSLEAVDIPLDEMLMPSIDFVKDEVSKGDVACVVGIACTTEFGVLEPIVDMAEVSSDAHFHSDAAFGGFVLPFMSPKPDPYDFRVPGVSSISIDPHKMGGAAIPTGALLLRERVGVEEIAVESPYLTTEKQSSLLGTRASAAVAGAYAAMRSLGIEGYRSRLEYCMENTRYLLKRCREEGLEPVIEPYVNILVLDVPWPKRVRETLAKKGWFVSNTRQPEGLRIVVMPHVTREVIDEFVPVLVDTLKELDKKN